jgi:hypothetical protein
MSNYANILTTGGGARVTFLNQCVRSLYTDYVFEDLVIDYRQHPSKAKAVALYEVFILDSGYQLNCNEILGPTARIHQIIAFYRESMAMNVFQKIALAGLRSADRNIFDHFLPAAFRQEDNAAMRQMIASGAIPNSDHNIRAGNAWQKTKEKLVRAGFDRIRCT